ncbi:MAG: helix-turn-helix domain-containing protein [Selenomonadales bacterium]|nr:helix-turn-helix domain-containing protein [Selenomonadales bacterium]
MLFYERYNEFAKVAIKRGWVAMVRDFPQLDQDVVFPPSETLLETLEHLGMTQLELARRTGTTPTHINLLAKGNAPLSPEMARALERATGVPASLWTNLGKNYQEARERGVSLVITTKR